MTTSCSSLGIRVGSWKDCYRCNGEIVSVLGQRDPLGKGGEGYSTWNASLMRRRLWCDVVCVDNRYFWKDSEARVSFSTTFTDCLRVDYSVGGFWEQKITQWKNWTQANTITITSSASLVRVQVIQGTWPFRAPFQDITKGDWPLCPCFACL